MSECFEPAGTLWSLHREITTWVGSTVIEHSTRILMARVWEMYSPARYKVHNNPWITGWDLKSIQMRWGWMKAAGFDKPGMSNQWVGLTNHRQACQRNVLFRFILIKRVLLVQLKCNNNCFIKFYMSVSLFGWVFRIFSARGANMLACDWPNQLTGLTTLVF